MFSALRNIASKKSSSILRIASYNVKAINYLKTKPAYNPIIRKELLSAFNNNQLGEIIKANQHQDLVEEALRMKNKLSDKNIRYLLKSLAEQGKVDELQRVKQVFDNPSLRARGYLAQAYFNSGRYQEYMDILVRGEEEPSVIFFKQLLSKLPEMEPRLLELSQEKPSFRRALFALFAGNHQFEKAEALLGQLEKPHSLRTLVRHANITKDVELGRKLLAWYPQTEMEPEKVHLYNVHLKNLAEAGALDEALQVLAEASQLPLHIRCLNTLALKLKEAGHPVPQDLEDKIKQSSSTSSSKGSSNISDDERQ